MEYNILYSYSHKINDLSMFIHVLNHVMPTCYNRLIMYIARWGITISGMIEPGYR